MALLIGDRMDMQLVQFEDRLDLSISAEAVQDLSGDSSGEEGVGGGGADLDRKEVWTFEDTSTLIDIYGETYVLKGCGVLRKRDWRQMAEQLASRTGNPKTTKQCRNRIDYLKRLYRREKQKYGITCLDSPWQFYKKMDLIFGAEAWKQHEVSRQAGIPGGIDGGEIQPGEPLSSVVVSDRPSASPSLLNPSDNNNITTVNNSNDNTLPSPKRTPPQCPPSNAPNKKKLRLVESLGRELKEGLGEFASALERIENLKMDLTLSIERERQELDATRARLEMERTRLILQNQLDLARMFYTKHQ